MKRVAIAGGGLAGSLCALALRRRRKEVDVLVVEEGETFGGNHIWSFFDTDIAPGAKWVVEGIDAFHWPRHRVTFPKRSRTIDIGYNSIRSSALDRAVRAELRDNQYRLGQSVASLTPEGIKLANGDWLEADAVIDARGPAPTPGLDLGWQKFVGRTYRFARPHGVVDPVIMDATVPQVDGYRFIYLLPWNDCEMLIEDTYYSASPDLDDAAVAARIDDVASTYGKGKCVSQERGVLPVVIDGDVEALWQGAEVAQIGLRGGFFHPTTSYSMPDAATNAAVLAAHGDYSSASVKSLFERRARQLWRDRGFFRLLNRLLFEAADPDQSYRVLEHFYRIPAGAVGRFYASRLKTMDKLRILSGKPPVKISRALRAIAGGLR